jgi:hypothetical protein
MGISLAENSFRRPHAHVVQLAEHIHNEDIKYVAGAILPLRTGTRMKLLRHLLIDPKTTYLTIDGQAHFRHTSMAGVTRSTARASPGPRSTSMVCHARVLYSTAASTRTVSVSSISCCSGFKRKVNSSNLSCNTSESRRIRSARLPLRPRSKSSPLGSLRSIVSLSRADGL